MLDVLRTDEVLEAYYKKRDALGDSFWDVDLSKFEPIKKWKYWVLVKNDFPYNRIAKQHDMLIPLRKFALEQDMNLQEFWEYRDIKKEISEEYNAFLENSTNNRSIAKLFHLHCIKYAYLAKKK